MTRDDIKDDILYFLEGYTISSKKKFKNLMVFNRRPGKVNSAIRLYTPSYIRLHPREKGGIFNSKTTEFLSGEDVICITTLREATEEEKKWFDNCVAAGRLLPNYPDQSVITIEEYLFP